MKQAATLYHTFTNNFEKAYKTHPAFAGREPLFRLVVLMFLCIALGIISYSSTLLFS